MLTESIIAQEVFQETDHRLMSVAPRYLQRLGILLGQHKQTVAELLEEMRRNAESVDELDS